MDDADEHSGRSCQSWELPLFSCGMDEYRDDWFEVGMNDDDDDDDAAHCREATLETRSLPSISYGPSLAESPVEHGGCDPELEPETAVENNVTVSASE